MSILLYNSLMNQFMDAWRFVFKNWNKQESFETTPSPYRDASSYDSIYDDFYSFYHDDLFFQPPYYEQLCKSMLSYINNVYNNHLCIGIKHGGHMNELLKNNMQTKSVSKSKSIVQVCKHHYKDHDYDYIPNVDTNPYVFDENCEFLERFPSVMEIVPGNIYSNEYALCRMISIIKIRFDLVLDNVRYSI